MAGVPDADLPIWKRAERGSRGPAPEHSRAAIAAAGVRLARTDGLAGVSMRRVAAAVGIAPASLYRYVAGREELLALMVDSVVAALDLPATPTGQGWRTDLLDIAHALRATYREHPWLLQLVVSGQIAVAMMGPALIDYTERVVAAMSELQVSGRTKMEASAMLNGVVGLFVTDETAAAGNTSPQAQAANAQYLADRVGDGEHPYLAAVLAAAPMDPAQEAARSADLFDRVVVNVMAGLLGAPPVAGS